MANDKLINACKVALGFIVFTANCGYKEELANQVKQTINEAINDAEGVEK